jgi:Ca2+-binding EF-hand superfamily protein
MTCSSALVISFALAVGTASTATAQNRQTQVRDMDRNNDGVITRNEWRGNDRAFQARDLNKDGILSGDELRSVSRRRQEDGDDRDNRSRDDTDRDGRITRAEWRGTAERFDLLDTNRDGVLTSVEVAGTPAPSVVPERSAAYRAGYDRGTIEGRAAGREDKERNQGWDLEGQRELEGADSGYDARFGPRAEYQSGYRDGFRRAYPDGYGPR